MPKIVRVWALGMTAPCAVVLQSVLAGEAAHSVGEGNNPAEVAERYSGPYDCLQGSRATLIPETLFNADSGACILQDLVANNGDQLGSIQIEVGLLHCNNFALSGGTCVDGVTYDETFVKPNYHCVARGTFQTGWSIPVTVNETLGSNETWRDLIGINQNNYVVFGANAPVATLAWAERSATTERCTSGYGPFDMYFQAWQLTRSGGPWTYSNANQLAQYCMTIGNLDSTGDFHVQK